MRLAWVKRPKVLWWLMILSLHSKQSKIQQVDGGQRKSVRLLGLHTALESFNFVKQRL